MTAAGNQVAEKQFVERMRALLVSLPYDLKVLFEALTDEDLPKEARQLAAGAIIYCLSPSDPIPDASGLIGYVDDTVLVRLVMKRLVEIGGEELDDYPQRFPEQFEGLDNDLKVIHGYLGDSIGWINRRIDKLGQLKHKGIGVAACVDDEDDRQRLYEDGLEFTTEYELDDESVRKLTSGKAIYEAFRKRTVEELRR